MLFKPQKHLFSLFACSVLALVPLHAASVDKITVFAAGGDVKATAPDSVTISNDSVWIAWTNGADSTGASGSSIVAQYDFTGKITNQYTIAGYVDGLKHDRERDLIWILQNQDGNSGLILLTPSTKAMTTLAYAVKSTTRGYDDVVFIDGMIYMSYTNPTGPTDPTIQVMTGVAPVTFQTIITSGATGTNLATGATNQATTDTDTDSLKATPFGGLMLTSGADSQLIFVDHPGQANQAVSFLQLIDPTTGNAPSSSDDAVFVTTPSGSFYVADTGNNRVLKVDVSDLQPMSLYASVTGLNMLANVDMKTGSVTPLLTNVWLRTAWSLFRTSFLYRAIDRVARYDLPFRSLAGPEGQAERDHLVVVAHQ
jgi:hypothetical protein